MTHSFSLRRCFFSSQGAAVNLGSLCTKHVAPYSHFKGRQFMGHWERTETLLHLFRSLLETETQQDCKISLHFSKTWVHQARVWDCVMPSQPPGKVTIFPWPGALFISLLAGLWVFQGRHHIVLFCFLQYLAKSKEKALLALYQVSKVLKYY